MLKKGSSAALYFSRTGPLTWLPRNMFQEKQKIEYQTSNMKITAVNELSPDFRSELAACWRHPSSRVVNTLTNFPTRNILHYFSLVFEVLLPLLDESKE